MTTPSLYSGLGGEHLAISRRPWCAFCLNTLSCFSSRAASSLLIDDITWFTISLATGMALFRVPRPFSVSTTLTDLLSALSRVVLTSPPFFKRSTSVVILCHSRYVHSAISDGLMLPPWKAKPWSTMNLIAERPVCR